MAKCEHQGEYELPQIETLQLYYEFTTILKQSQTKQNPNSLVTFERMLGNTFILKTGKYKERAKHAPVHVTAQGNRVAGKGKFSCRDIFQVTNEKGMTEDGRDVIPNALVSL